LELVIMSFSHHFAMQYCLAKPIYTIYYINISVFALQY